ncbi:MAG: hypothetical protein MSC53_04665 [Arcanobacterium sp.]|nr:hypothetical protein [Arcanobacterium sp.]MDY5273700.1 hypothetical protein [Arcanobacterium sp.]
MTTVLQYSDDSVEILCLRERAVVHDRLSDKYFDVSADAVRSKISGWHEYKSAIPRPLLALVFISFGGLLAFDYIWFFSSNNFRFVMSDTVVLVLFLAFNIAAHELAHVAALRLCGRKIDKLGFKFNYGVLPAFYVRMNQVLLLSRGERIFCHLAGLWTNLCVVCAVVIAEYAGYSSMSLASAAYIFLTMLIMNLLPILNTDGQKVVTTFLGVEKPKNIKSAGSLLKTIHVISIIAAGAIVLRFCLSLLLLFRVG